MFDTILHHPQRLWVRRALFQVHLWAGILVAVYVAVIGATGSLLVFEEEFTAMTLPRPAQAFVPQRTAALAPMVRAAEQAAPGGHVDFVMMPTADAPFFRVWLKKGAEGQTVRLADATTGTLLPTQGRTWIEWVHDLHVYLLAGQSGLIANGVGAALLLLVTATGSVLWWRGLARWTRGLGVRLKGSWRRVNFDLHSAVGLWTLGIVSWWAISGVYFVWPSQVARAVNAVSKLEGMRPPVARADAAGGGGVSLDALVERARAASPGAFLSGVAPAAEAGGPVTVYMDVRAPGDFSHRDIHTFSSRTGALLSTWHYGDNRTAGDWFMWATYPLHFGTLWGLGPKIIWALAGLSLPLLAVTGILMYWNRKLRFLVRRWRDAGSAGTAAGNSA